MYRSYIICLLFTGLLLAPRLTRAHEADLAPVYSMQSQIMAYINQVKKGIEHTNYDQVIDALHQLEEVEQATLVLLIDPLAPLYELIQALNIQGREYFLVPELKLYVSQVAYRYAQQVYRIVYACRKPVTQESKAMMHQHLSHTLQLLDPNKEPVTPVIFNLRYIRAVVDNLPDTQTVLEEGIPFLLNLLDLVQAKDIEAGLNLLSAFINKGQVIYRCRQVEQITFVAALEKSIVRYNDPAILDNLYELYQTTIFEDVRYAIIQALGRISRAYYGSADLSVQDLQASKKAFKAFDLLLSAVIPKESGSTIANNYIRAGAAFELILLQNLLDTMHSQVVERYLSTLVLQSSNPKSWWERLKAKMSFAALPNPVQCVVNNRSTIFRMSHIEKMKWQKPIDPIQSSLNRIEAQQKAILEILKAKQ